MTPSPCPRTARILLQPTNKRLPVAILSLWALIVLKVADAAPPASSREETVIIPDVKASRDKWLTDETFYDVNYLIGGNNPQNESDIGQSQEFVSDLCPPVPASLPEGGCDVEKCTSDRQCEGRKLKCCYNGCVYTCLPEVNPAPHFDWIIEPRRRLQFGPSWLISGPDDNVNVETCSTSPLEEDDDADPLVCPHGYECSIDDPGKPEDGIPNQGHCVKMMDVRQHAAETAQKSIDPDHRLQADAPHEPPTLAGCMLDEEGRMLISGHSILIDDRECLCFKTKLMCDI